MSCGKPYAFIQFEKDETDARQLITAALIADGFNPDDFVLSEEHRHVPPDLEDSFSRSMLAAAKVLGQGIKVTIVRPRVNLCA